MSVTPPSTIDVSQEQCDLRSRGRSENRAGQTAAVIREHWPRQPLYAVILGTGLGDFVDALNIECSLNYEELPHFPRSTAIGHQGRLICGLIEDVPVIALQGRCHVYEGAQLDEICYAVDVLHALGIVNLIVSCAAGGLSTSFEIGELMIINDHIDFLFQQPAGDVSSHRTEGKPPPEIYDSSVNQTLRSLARRFDIPLRDGTYIAVQGPNYETRAELRFFQKIGDAIGMSTVPEAMRAHQLGIQVNGIATITNICNPDQNTEADGHQVVEVATRAEPQFRQLVCEFIKQADSNNL